MGYMGTWSDFWKQFCRDLIDETQDQLPDLAIRWAVQTAYHPFAYANTLIQIGHEPLSPYPTKSLFFRRPILGLPNLLHYVGHIHRVDGFSGCYRGLFSRLIGYTVNHVAYNSTFFFVRPFVDDYIDDHVPCLWFQKEGVPLAPKLAWLEVFYSTLAEVLSRITSVVLSQPFHVISIRIMAQFVGRETKYDGIFAPIAEVYRTNGVLGFFAGLVPRLMAELFVIAFAHVSVFLIEDIFDNYPEDTSVTGLPMSLLGSLLSYPLNVISSCMAVNNSGLAAGMPPRMPIYSSWIDCWMHLWRNNQTGRGRFMFFRRQKTPLSRINYRRLVVRE